MTLTLEQLEKLATKHGSSAVILHDGQEFRVTKITKSVHRRFSYKHGDRNMGRDEVEQLFIKGN